MADTSSSNRAVLHVQDTLDWLTAIEDYSLETDGPLDPAYESPSTYDVYLPSIWEPIPDRVHADPEQAHHTIITTIATALRAAAELGRITLPAGIEILINDTLAPGTYNWILRADRYSYLTLTSGEPAPIEEIGTSHDHEAGASRMLAILQEATAAANQMLTALHHGAPIVLADTSTDPVLLTRLADSPDPAIRSAVLDNAAAPDEARVLASLHSLT